MAHSIATGAEGSFAAPRAAVGSTSPAYQAYQILHIAFVLALVIAGLDKFFYLLANWDMYLAPAIANLSPIQPHDLMRIIGVVEIIAGSVVAVRPRIGAYMVAAWLAAIIVNFLILPGFFDVALRDFGLMLGALALGRLSKQYDV